MGPRAHAPIGHGQCEQCCIRCLRVQSRQPCIGRKPPANYLPGSRGFSRHDPHQWGGERAGLLGQHRTHVFGYQASGRQERFSAWPFALPNNGIRNRPHPAGNGGGEFAGVLPRNGWVEPSHDGMGPRMGMAQVDPQCHGLSAHAARRLGTRGTDGLRIRCNRAYRSHRCCGPDFPG